MNYSNNELYPAEINLKTIHKRSQKINKFIFSSLPLKPIFLLVGVMHDNTGLQILGRKCLLFGF